MTLGISVHKTKGFCPVVLKWREKLYILHIGNSFFHRTELKIMTNSPFYPNWCFPVPPFFCLLSGQKILIWCKETF